MKGMAKKHYLYWVLYYLFKGILVYGQLDVNVVTPEWALLGSNPQMECRFDFDSFDNVVSVAWNAIDDLSHTDPTTAPSVVYYVRGVGIGGDEADRVDLNLTDFTLTIPNVLLTDERKYFCIASTVLASGDDNGITKVSDVPRSVVVNFTDPNLVNGTATSLTCFVDHAKPAASITWDLDGELQQDHTQINITDGQDGYFDSESTLEFMPLWKYHNATLRCTANVPADLSGVSHNITLDVKVPPYDEDMLIFNEQNNEDGYINIIEGQNNTIFCEIQNTRPAAEVKWFIDGINQTTGVGPPIVSPTVGYNDLVDTLSSLTVVPVRAHHEQIITCKASIPIVGAPSAEKSSTLKVIGPPDPPVMISPSYVKEGESSHFECTASNSYPGGMIAWYVDDELAQIGGDNMTNSDGRYDLFDSFQFTPLRSDNNDIVACEARHETLKGPDLPKDSSEIDVKFCSTTTEIMGCPSVVAGNNVTMTCISSSANPSSNLEWYEGDIKMPNTHEATTSPSDHGGNITTLLFTTRTINQDDFEIISFTCCSSNLVAECALNCSNLCMIDVQYHTQDVIISKSTEGPILEDENETIALTCSGDGNPVPFLFTWFKDGIEIDGEDEDTLVYENVTRENAGIYQCVAGNGLQPDGESPFVNITVYYNVNITNKYENSKRVDAGRDVVMQCITKGLPLPEIIWTGPNGNTLPNDDERMFIVEQIQEDDPIRGIQKRSLLTIYGIIPEIDDGKYTCTAYNTIGQPDVMTIDLNKPTVPDPVFNLHEETSTDTSVTTAWEATFSGGIGVDQWFVVDYRAYNDEGPGEWTKEVIVTVQRFTATNLIASTTYEIRVFSENDFGRNMNGQRVNATTEAAGSPTDVFLIYGTVGIAFGITSMIVVAVMVIYLRCIWNQKQDKEQQPNHDANDTNVHEEGNVQDGDRRQLMQNPYDMRIEDTQIVHNQPQPDQNGAYETFALEEGNGNQQIGDAQHEYVGLEYEVPAPASGNRAATNDTP